MYWLETQRDDTQGKPRGIFNWGKNIVVQSEEKRFEDYVDHARTSEDIAHMDNWCEANRLFVGKKSEQTHEDEESQNLTCCVCNMTFQDSRSLESHVDNCFENCTMYDY